MVEEIKELRTELESVTFFESPILGHREVDIGDGFSSNGTFAQRPELARRRDSEGRGIQVFRRIAGEIEWRPCVVRALTHRRRSAQPIHVGKQFNRSGAKIRRDSIQLPITQNKLSRLAPTAERRQGVNQVADKGVSAIKVCVAPIAVEVERVTGGVSERC